jgi:DUF2892 family protein
MLRPQGWKSDFPPIGTSKLALAKPRISFHPGEPIVVLGASYPYRARPDAPAARKGAFSMFYVKNLPLSERVLRIIAGMVLIILGMLYFHGGLHGLWGLLSAGSGAGAIATGFLGFCPACAMVGRKLDKQARGD